MSDRPAAVLAGNLTRDIIFISRASAVGLVAIFLVDVVGMLPIRMPDVEVLVAAVGFAGTVLFFTTSICIGMAIAGGILVPTPAQAAAGAGSGPLQRLARHRADQLRDADYIPFWLEVLGEDMLPSLEKSRRRGPAIQSSKFVFRRPSLPLQRLRSGDLPLR